MPRKISTTEPSDIFVLVYYLASTIPAEKTFDQTVYATQQYTSLAEDVRLELRLECGVERVRRANGDTPAQSTVDSIAVNVLMDRKTCVDTGTIHLLALLVQPAHRRSTNTNNDSSILYL